MSNAKSSQLPVILGIVLLANFLFCVPPSHAQGRLARVREKVRHAHPPAPARPQAEEEDDEHDHGHRSGRRRNRDCHFGLNLFSVGYAAPPVCPPPACFPPVCAPPVVEHLHFYEPAPVVVSQPVVEPVIEESAFDNCDPPICDEVVDFDPILDNWFAGWCGRLSAFGGSNFDDLSHASLGFLVQDPGQLGLDIGVFMFRESSPSVRDHLWLGDVNVVYEAINSGRLRARMGLGVNWLGDALGGDAGANLTFGFDWQMSRHWILTGETDFGSLGDTDLFHARLSLGRQFEQAEWATGYDYRDIGGANFGGLFTGLQFRF